MPLKYHDRNYYKKLRSSIPADYINGMSYQQIANHYNVSGSLVYRVIKEAGVIPRKPTETSRIYTLNETFFDKINTEEKAYILGFIYADGYVSYNPKTRRASIRILLQGRDTHLLEKISKILDSNKPLEYVVRADTKGKNRPYTILNVYSKHMLDSIVSFAPDCLSPKALNIRLPYLPDSLMPHFIRGYFDGDGHVGLDKTGLPVIHFSSNPMFIQDLYNYFNENLGLVLSIAKQSKNTHVLHCHCWEKSVTILRYMYDGSSLFLDRKFSKAQTIIGKSIINTIKDETPRYPKEYLLELYAQYKTWVDVANYLKIKDTALHYHLRKLNIYKEDFQPKVGDKFGRLVIEEIFSDKRGKDSYNVLRVKCSCECGGEIVTRMQAVKSGTTKSCGCLFLEVAAEKGKMSATKRKDNVWLEYEGVRKTQAQWTREFNVSHNFIRRGLVKGMSFIEIVEDIRRRKE